MFEALDVLSRSTSASRRDFLQHTGALAAAGWVSVGATGWMLPASGARAAEAIKVGIGTDITGAMAPSGNACWQMAQLAVDELTASGGILGRPVQLFLEDTASKPNVGIGNVRRLVQQHRCDVILGGLTSSMRQAIKDPIVKRGKTLYIYPQLYEGQECTPYLFNTGPTPAQQCDALIPYLIKTLGKKRFALPSANYVWPRLLNQYLHKVIKAHGGQVVFEEYYPVDQAEYSATISKISSDAVDCVFVTLIPPGIQPFMKQLYESGFQKSGGVSACVYYDENALNFNQPHEIDGLLTCLDYFQNIDDPFSKALLDRYNKKFPNSKYMMTAGSGSTGMYRGIMLYAEAVKATKGNVKREAVAKALDTAKLAQGPGGPCEVVPGTMHVKMNMYLARCKTMGDKASFEIISKADMIDPKEC